jgi:hypothetical protein
MYIFDFAHMVEIKEEHFLGALQTQTEIWHAIVVWPNLMQMVKT